MLSPDTMLSFLKLQSGGLPLRFEEIMCSSFSDAYELRFWMGEMKDYRNEAVLFRTMIPMEKLLDTANDHEALTKVISRPVKLLRDLKQKGYDEGFKKGIEEGKRQVEQHFKEVGKLQSHLPRG